MSGFLQINKEGKYSPQAIKDLAKLTHVERPEIRDLLIEIADECIHISDEDRCELASKIVDCGIKAAEERNIDYREL